MPMIMLKLEDIAVHKDHLNQLHRKFNLLSSWLQLKFSNDPSFPRSLNQNSIEKNTESEAEYRKHATEGSETKPCYSNNTSQLKITDVKSILESTHGSHGGSDNASAPMSPCIISGGQHQEILHSSPSNPAYRSETKPCTVNIQRLDLLGDTKEDPNKLIIDDELDIVADYEPHEPEEQESSGNRISESPFSSRNNPARAKSWACTDCHRSFDSSHKLLFHKYKVHRVRVVVKTSGKKGERKKRIYPVHQCQHCEKRYSDIRILMTHVTKFHSDATRISAKPPGQFQGDNNIKAVVNPVLQCQFCQKMYTTGRYLRKHIRERHGDEKNLQEVLASFRTRQTSHVTYCEPCKKQFNSLASFKTHLRQYHPKEFEEKVKNGEIPHRRSNKRKRTQDDVGVFLPERVKCPQCQTEVKRRSLRSHIRYTHEQAHKPFLCSQCGFATKTKDLLRSHMEKHADDKKYKCSQCPYAARQERGLYYHNSRYHNPSPTQHQCSLCGELFKMASYLKQHISNVHENRRAYPCNLCEKAFKSQHSLKYHIKTHQNPNARKRGLNKDREPKRRAPSIKSKSEDALNK